MSYRARRSDAAIAVLAALLVICSLVAGKAARDAILLSHFRVTSLPLFVGLAAVISLPMVLLIGRLIGRFGPSRVVPVLNLLSAALLVGEWLLHARMPRPAAAITFLHLSSLGAVLVSGFWSIINERFDARTARTLIGRIGVGATLGGIVGGVIAERCAAYLEPTAILLVLAGLQLIAGVVQRLLHHARAAALAPVTNEVADSALRTVVRTPLLRNLALVVMLAAVAAGCLDFVFKAKVVAATGAEGPLRFFAIYYTVTNVLTALVQLAFARLVLTRLGIARTIATLPATVSLVGGIAVAVPGLWPVVIARASEMVTRSSLYRAAYELVFAPLAGAQKRATKVLIDVGAERVGDLLGAQLVGVLIYLVVPPVAFVVGALLVSVVALAVALRVAGSYTRALEQSLLVQKPTGVRPNLDWSTVGPPSLTDSGDRTALSLLGLSIVRAADTPATPEPVLDPQAQRIADLRSGDLARVTHALRSPCDETLLPHVVPLIAWDEAATQATHALRAIAPGCTGALVERLVDPDTEFAIRRRLPAILEVGAPQVAVPGLWRGLNDQRFEVRYRCAKALARMRDAGQDVDLAAADVFAQITRELAIDRHIWQNHRLLDPVPVEGDDAVIDRIAGSSRGIEHVFTLLSLVLPPGPVRIAQHALYTTDRALRGTALEYLETVLPDNVRALLWPHLEPESKPAAPRTHDKLVEELTLSQPAILANLRARAK